MDYVIKNDKNVYIRLNQNGSPVTCSEREKTLFEYSKARNILENLSKTLRRLNFKVEPIPEPIQTGKKDKENKVIQSEKYVVSDQITQWIEKFGICDDILKEAQIRKDELNKIISNYDRAVSNWLHEVEIEKKKNACKGYLKYSDIKDIVDKRRVAKDEWMVINKVLQMNFNSLDVETINRVVIGLTKRKFTYRLVEEDKTESVL